MSRGSRKGWRPVAEPVRVETVIVLHFSADGSVPDEVEDRIVTALEQALAPFIVAGDLPGYRDCCFYSMEGEPGEFHSKELLPGVGVVAPPIGGPQGG